MRLSDSLVKLYHAVTYYIPRRAFAGLSHIFSGSLSYTSQNIKNCLNRYFSHQFIQITHNINYTNFCFRIINHPLESQWRCLELLDLFPQSSRKPEIYDAISSLKVSRDDFNIIKRTVGSLPEDVRGEYFLEGIRLISDKTSPNAIDRVFHLIKDIPSEYLREELIRSVFEEHIKDKSDKIGSPAEEFCNLIRKFPPQQALFLLKWIPVKSSTETKVILLKTLSIIPPEKITLAIVDALLTISERHFQFYIEELEREIASLVTLDRLDILAEVQALIIKLDTPFARWWQSGSSILPDIISLIQALKDLTIEDYRKIPLLDIPNRIPELIKVIACIPSKLRSEANIQKWAFIISKVKNIGFTKSLPEKLARTLLYYLENYPKLMNSTKKVSPETIQRFINKIPSEDSPRLIENSLNQMILFKTGIPSALRSIPEENLEALFNALESPAASENDLTYSLLKKIISIFSPFSYSFLSSSNSPRLEVADVVNLLQTIAAMPVKNISRGYILDMFHLASYGFSNFLLKTRLDVISIRILKAYVNILYLSVECRSFRDDYNKLKYLVEKLEKSTALPVKNIRYMIEILSYDLTRAKTVVEYYYEKNLSFTRYALKKMPDFSGDERSIQSVAQILQYERDADLIKSAFLYNPELDLEVSINYAVSLWNKLMPLLKPLDHMSIKFLSFFELCMLIPSSELNQQTEIVFLYLNSINVHYQIIYMNLKKVPVQKRSNIFHMLSSFDLKDVELKKIHTLLEILSKFEDVPLDIAAKYIKKDQYIIRKETVNGKERECHVPFKNLIARCFDEILSLLSKPPIEQQTQLKSV